VNRPTIILASASPRRELLLREMGLTFSVVAPTDVEEAAGGAAPDVVALHNAQRKARAVAGRQPLAWVIGADTIVVLDGEIFGKPRDRAEAAVMLGRLAGRPHTVITGVCLVRRCSQSEISFTEMTRVWMRALTPAQIAAYHDRVNPLDKAGAYGAQEFGASIIERIEGSFPNVMGLPVERLRATLDLLSLKPE
jgi:septum formation protein